MTKYLKICLKSVLKTHLKDFIDLNSVDFHFYEGGLKFETNKPNLKLANLNAKLNELSSPITIKSFHADKIEAYVDYESISSIKKVGIKTFGLKLVLKLTDPAHRTSPAKQNNSDKNPSCNRIVESHEDIGKYLSKIYEDENSKDTKNPDGTEILANQLETIIANIDLDCQDTTLYLQCQQSNPNEMIELKFEIDSFTFHSKDNVRNESVSIADIQRVLILMGMKMYLSEQKPNTHLHEPTLIAAVKKKQEYILVHKADFPFISFSKANLDRITIFLSPCQLNLLTEMVKCIKEALNLKEQSSKDHYLASKHLYKEDYALVEHTLVHEYVLANNNVHLNKPQGWTQLNESTDSFKSFQSSQTTFNQSFGNSFQNGEIMPVNFNVKAICLVILQEKPANNTKVADKFFLDESCNISHFYALAEYLDIQFDVCPDSGNFSINVSGKDLTILEKLSTRESNVRVANTLLKFSQAISNNFVLNMSSLPKSFKVSLDLKPVFVELDLTLIDRVYKMFSQSFCNHLSSIQTDYNDPSEASFSIIINCPTLNACLKIPVIDLINTNKNWEEQNVHKEMLLMQFSKCSIEKKATDHYIVQAQEILTSLLLGNRDIVDLFNLKNLSHELQEKQFDWPRINIKLNNTKPSVFNYVTSLEESIHPSYQYVTPSTCDKLFEKISMFMESSQKEIENAFQPANKTQTTAFINETLGNCFVHVDILAPIVHLWLPEKKILDIVYNRLFKDLALWQPYKPSYVPEAHQSFFSCSSILYDSNYEEDMTTSIYQSELSSMTRSQYYKPSVKPQVKAEHKLGLKLIVTQCEVSIKGFERISMVVDNGFMFLVSGYENETNHSHFSLQLNKVSVLFDKLPILSFHRGQEDMVNVAVSVKVNNAEEQNASKEILVAAGLSNCLFHYYDDTSAFKWIEDLVDYVDVEDYPIPGYIPFDPKLNINLCLNKVSLDYRPKDFKYKAILSLNSFSISSNFIRHQVLLENFEFFLSNKVKRVGINLCSDYVKLMEVLLLEFSFQSSNVVPYIDFIASNNSINFWVCSDSLQAVVSLLEHIMQQSQSGPLIESKHEDVVEEFNNSPNVKLDLMEDAIEESKSVKVKPNTVIDPADMDFVHLGMDFELEDNSLDEPEIENLVEDLCTLTEDNCSSRRSHFFRPEVKTDPLKPPKNFPVPLYKILLKNFSLNFHLYGGEDFGEKMFEVVPTKCEGGPGRQKDISMELHFNKIKYQHEIYANDCDKAFRQVLLIRSFEIQDKHKNSNINKFLYEYVSDKFPRQTESNMLLLKVLHTRPEATLKSTECSIYMTVKPLRLNIDQTSFYFLNEFFDLSKKGTSDSDSDPQDISSSLKPESPTSDSNQMFIKSFVLSHDIPIKLDYNGKKEDNEQGYAALALNYLDLENAQLILKKKCYIRGILGIQKLLYNILSEWADDICKNQLHNVVFSVGKLNYLIKALNGIIDFFLCPLLQYQKDGTIIKGFHKGTQSFTENSICTLLTFICGFISSCHTLFMRAFPSQYRNAYQMKLPAADLKEGINDCISIFQTGAKHIIYGNHNNKGMTGAIGDVICTVPRVTLEVSNRAIEGLRYQLEPKAHLEQMEKWKNCNKS